MLDDSAVGTIILEANTLKSRYDIPALESMLEAALEDLDGPITLHGLSAKEFLKDVLLYLGDTIERYRVFTNAVVNAWVTTSVIEYLVSHNIIKPQYESRDAMIIYVTVALIMEGAYQLWKKYRATLDSST